MQGTWVRKPLGDTAVVFVHGFLSSGESCWLDKHGAYWPNLLREEEKLAKVGIYVYSYQTEIFSGSYRLSDVVDDFKERAKLDTLWDSKQIIFVCHSMGGIVIRKFLVERHSDLIERKVSVGLFLVASPSLGSDYADLLKAFADILGNSQAQALRFVRSNAWLSDLDKEFINLKESRKLPLMGKEVIEDKFIVLRKIWKKHVVEPFSGARYFGDPYKVPHSDHFSIAKPGSRDAIQHRLLCQFIEKCSEAGLQPGSAVLQQTQQASDPITPKRSAPVAFKSERAVNENQLLKAVHSMNGAAQASVMLQYDPRVSLLQGKLQSLYDNYEQLLGRDAEPDGLAKLHNDIEFTNASLGSLPETVALLAQRLRKFCDEQRLGDKHVITVCSRFVEMRMTQILSKLARYQLVKDPEPVLVEYADLNSIAEYVALVDGIALEEIVSYHIQFFGDTEERLIFAPIKYGNERLLIQKEFARAHEGYIPPLSFMMLYAYPQMVLWNAARPDNWSFEWRCRRVDAKNLEGLYLD